MKNKIIILMAAVMLAACASGSNGGSQMYGEITGGVETSRTF